jgi:hypothetical protein
MPTNVHYWSAVYLIAVPQSLLAGKKADSTEGRGEFLMRVLGCTNPLNITLCCCETGADVQHPHYANALTHLMCAASMIGFGCGHVHSATHLRLSMETQLVWLRRPNLVLGPSRQLTHPAKEVFAAVFASDLAAYKCKRPRDCPPGVDDGMFYEQISASSGHTPLHLAELLGGEKQNQVKAHDLVKLNPSLFDGINSRLDGEHLVWTPISRYLMLLSIWCWPCIKMPLSVQRQPPSS